MAARIDADVYAPLTAEPTVLNCESADLPMNVPAMMMTAAIRATISPYSTAVAPFSSAYRVRRSAYHVRAGNDVLRNGVIHTDTYSFAGTALPWLDQQWAAQVLFALAYRLGGWNALILLDAALSALGVAFLYLACRASGARVRTAAILSVAGYVVASNNLAMRPQLVAVPLFTATLWLLAGRQRHPGRLWWIPAITVVWANAHGSFALAPLLVGLAWLDDRRLRSPRASRTLLVAAVSLLATLLNPFGFAAWTYIVTI